MARQTKRRHLSVVPAPGAEDAPHTPTGMTEPKRAQAPLEPTAVYASEAATTRTAAGAAERARHVLATGHTYAVLAWLHYWNVAMGYVMDPDLRTEMVDQAERDLDHKRVAAAKRARRALSPEDKRAAQREIQRLERRCVSELEVDARTLGARSGRLLRKLALPAAVVVGPVLMAANGMWIGVLIWPAAWGWLAVQGRAHAIAEGTTTATELPPTAVADAPRPPAVTGAPANPATAAGAAQATRVLGATPEENVILERLADWTAQAKSRGLAGLTPGAPTLDEAGLCVVLTLDGKWDPGRVRGAVGQIRAALAVPAEAGVQITPGARGDEAVLRIRTRTPALDTSWYEGREGIGIVPETGRIAEVSPYGHRLVAGTTGAGKSTAMRPWMARVAMNPLAALVFIDPKGQECPLWEHCARTVKGVGAAGQQRVYLAISEVALELEWRQEHAGGTDWTPTEEHPELVLVVDEGASIVRMSKTKSYKDVLDKLEYIAAQGRAGRIWLHWATQYPTKSEGIPALVTENITTRLSLRTESPTADRVVFGENATATGWTPSELEIPGWAMIRTGPKDAPPDHTRLWHMTDEQVRALPARAAWHHAGAPSEAGEDLDDGEMPEVLAAALELSEGQPGVRGHDIAGHLGWDLIDVQTELLALEVRAGRYSDDGRQVRGYPREDLEAAAANYGM
ncbi:FtsK/SpoIIIE domain-containing protein [Marinactinospora rubrisoli]|uniref:FtsK/SpoIIIE domain-containing protein n=1 Tax=Marinactinospora rubrisoli TaxID=2715399 RepID=A0ABW2KN30_9ACTN